MGIIATALAPVIFLIVLGYMFKKTEFLPHATWPGVEKLTYFVLLPALLIKVISGQEISGSNLEIIFLIVGATVITCATILVIWKFFDKKITGPVFTSIFQGGVRFNTYIVLSVAYAFFGDEGLALSAIISGFIIILINLLLISAFSIWGSNGTRGFKPFAKEILYNPLIISCVIGWIISLSGVTLPAVVLSTLEITGRAALLLGLLAVGASLNLSAVKGHVRPIIIASASQFFLKPLVVTVYLYFAGINGVTASVVTLFFMTPTASSACILARQLGGDAEVMSSIITFQTIFAFVTMPVIVYLTF